MIHITNLQQNLPLFKALSSDVRIQILELLTKYEHLNMNEIAAKLNLTSGAVTSHIKKLNDCGLIEVNSTAGKQGIQKICYLPKDRIIIEIGHENTSNAYEVDINVGHYSNYKVNPTCGIASKDKIIGEFDDPRYFDDPNRVNAQILWFTSGYIEYKIPNYIKSNQVFSELQFSMEISSEAPSVCNNWPSNIYFYINDIELGSWISPGDFGSKRGVLNPDWWSSNLNQHGLLKLLQINNYGTYIDGIQISNITLNDLNLNYKSSITLKLEVPEKSKYVGGLTLYGESFGNYSQGIHGRIIYQQDNDENNII